MQDVNKLKILIKKYDKLGEEEYSEGNNPYEKLMGLISNVVTDKKFASLEHERRNSYSSSYDQQVKNRVAYCDKLFSSVYSHFKKEANYGWANPELLTMALIGIAYWIVNNSGFKDKEIDKYLGKLCNKYEKIFGINPDKATEITKMYDKQKVSIQRAVDIETKTKASIQEIKNDFKNHKYTIFCDSNNTSAQIYVIDNSDYESLDDAFEKTVKIETSGSPLNNYNLDSKLRQLVSDNKINALFLCSGYYCIGQDKEKTIPKFGYYDEELPGKTLYQYSTHDSNYYYSGKIPAEKKSYLKNQGPLYSWYDSLWTVHN